jgi:hypothetical protein
VLPHISASHSPIAFYPLPLSIIYIQGSLIHVFPVIGSEIGSKHVPFAPSSDASPDLEYLQGSSVRPSSMPPTTFTPSPAVSSIASEVTSTVTSASYTAMVQLDTEDDSGGDVQGKLPPEGAVEQEREQEQQEAAVAETVEILQAIVGTSAPPVPESSLPTIPANPDYPPLSSPIYGDSSALAVPAGSTGLTDSDPAKKPSFFGIGFDRIFGRRLVEAKDTQTGVEGRGEGVGAIGSEGNSNLSVGTAAPTVIGAVSVSSGPGAARGYSYTAEELEQEEGSVGAGAGAGATQSVPLPLDSRVGIGAKSSKDFPEHPAFQPVFSTVKKDKTEDFTPDSYYDQFINEKQFFLSSEQAQVGADGTKVSSTDRTGGEAGKVKKGGAGDDKNALNLYSQVRRILKELEAEAVFSEIDNSARRGIMLRIWEEIKDSEATLISSLGKQAEEGGEEEEDDDEEEEDEDEDEEAEG